MSNYLWMLKTKTLKAVEDRMPEFKYQVTGNEFNLFFSPVVTGLNTLFETGGSVSTEEESSREAF